MSDRRVGPEWEIPLYMPRRNRAGDVVLAIVVAVVGLSFMVAFLAFIVGLFQNFWGYVAAAALVAVIVVIITTVVQTIRRAFRRKVCLRLFPDALEIDHYLRFRKPYRIPKERVKTVVVDAIHSPAPDLGEMASAVATAERKPRARLPVIGLDRLDRSVREASALGAFLFSNRGSPLPLVVSEMKDTPNLAVIFDEPVVLSTARRTYLSGATDWSTAMGFVDLHLPSPKRPTGGFLTRAVDPYKAYVTFDAWGVLPTSEASAADVVHAFPSRTELSKERARRRGTWIAIFVAVLLVGYIGDRVAG